MAKISFSGLESYIESLERLGKSSEEVAKKALYEGAKIAADTVKEEIGNLPTDESWGTQEKPSKGIKEKQKQGLIDSFGVSPMQNKDGFLNVKLGFDGYNDIKSQAHPSGQPNALIARVAESGTSFSKKTPFMAKAVRRAKGQAEAKMKETFENEIENIMKE